jgi:hypothetical protein
LHRVANIQIFRAGDFRAFAATALRREWSKLPVGRINASRRWPEEQSRHANIDAIGPSGLIKRVRQ